MQVAVAAVLPITRILPRREPWPVETAVAVQDPVDGCRTPRGPDVMEPTAWAVVVAVVAPTSPAVVMLPVARAERVLSLCGAVIGFDRRKGRYAGSQEVSRR